MFNHSRRLLMVLGFISMSMIILASGVQLMYLASQGNQTAVAIVWLVLATIALVLLSATMTGLLVGFNWIRNLLRKPSQQEKTKRESLNHEEDPRLALLMSLMTPDERDTLKARLADEISSDGELLSLADLLMQQEGSSHRYS